MGNRAREADKIMNPRGPGRGRGRGECLLLEHLTAPADMIVLPGKYFKCVSFLFALFRQMSADCDRGL